VYRTDLSRSIIVNSVERGNPVLSAVEGLRQAQDTLSEVRV